VGNNNVSGSLEEATGIRDLFSPLLFGLSSAHPLRSLR